jgi:hypothetical protein
VKQQIFSVILILCLIQLATAQTPSGTIAGVVRDPSGSAIAGAQVRAVNVSLGLSRALSTVEDGDYGFTALLPGEYEVSVEAAGFKRVVRTVSVEAGATTTSNFDLGIGALSESVTVDGVSPQMRYDSHSVGGAITRSQIVDLPLNGRSFLELAKLNAGVQPPTRASSNRMFVPVLGAPGGNNGRGTRVTVDGGSVMALGNGGSAMNFSQEGVQEFQISTVSFDLSSGLTFSGAINVVTRSGGKNLHGTAFSFFRDHNLAAYPALNRDLLNPDPFFQRRQFGFDLEGPIRRDRVFFFGNWERNEQRGVLATTLLGDVARWTRVTPTPSFGNQASLRFDALLSDRHTGFVRYSHDGSRSFGPGINQLNAYPSNWTRQLGWVDQSILGLTSVLRPTLVNDLRFSYFFISSSQVPPTDQDCPGCLGIGGPAITVSQTGLTIGQSDTQRILSRRFHLYDTVSAQRRNHRTRIGVDWEYNRGGALNWTFDPVTMSLFPPERVRSYNSQTPPELRIPLPSAFDSLEALLQLPLQRINIGIGDPRVPQENGTNTRTWDTVRLFFQDTWRLHERLTVNYGLGWSIDRNLNYDLAKPALLAPILGDAGLGPTQKEWSNLSPVFGVAWMPSRDGKTVIRAGGGIFYDFLFPNHLDAERSLLGPAGLGRQNVPGTRVLNTLPGIAGVPVGTPLDFSRDPTLFRGADLLTILPARRAALTASLATADRSFSGIELAKQGTLSPVNVPSWSAQHINAGVQRQIAADFIISADFAYRHFIHLGSTPDLNHFESVRGPVIPRCVGEAQMNDPHLFCSNGSINILESSGRATYKGLLLRAEKRFSHRFQLLASLAYSSNNGTNTGNGFDLDNRLANVGPLTTDYTRIANIAGVVQLPWRFDSGFNFSYSSVPPLSAYLGDVDFTGDSTRTDLLPGTTVNVFNRGMDRKDLQRLVAKFNETYANTRDARNVVIATVTLPVRYSLGDNFHSLDLRVKRSFVLRDRYTVAVIGEAFNVYNAANLSGFSGNLNSPAFGQPTNRLIQVFGSGGPRAFQLATRVSF